MTNMREAAKENFPYLRDFFPAFEIAPKLPPTEMLELMTNSLTVAVCQHSTADLYALTLELRIPHLRQLNPTPFTLTFNAEGKYLSYSNSNQRTLNLTTYEIAVLELAWKVKNAVDS